MSPAEHVRASTEPGPLGLLLWACTVVLAVACSAITGPWFAPVLICAGCIVVMVAWAIARMGSLCDEVEGHDEHDEAFNTDIEPWHMPHMRNQPNDGGAQ